MNVAGYRALLAAALLPAVSGADEDGSTELMQRIVQAMELPEPAEHHCTEAQEIATQWRYADIPDAFRDDLVWALHRVAYGDGPCMECVRRLSADDPCEVAAKVPPGAAPYTLRCDEHRQVA